MRTSWILTPSAGRIEEERTAQQTIPGLGRVDLIVFAARNAIDPCDDLDRSGVRRADHDRVIGVRLESADPVVARAEDGDHRRAVGGRAAPVEDRLSVLTAEDLAAGEIDRLGDFV